jgi:hypothetical protein
MVDFSPSLTNGDLTKDRAISFIILGIAEREDEIWVTKLIKPRQ